MFKPALSRIPHILLSLFLLSGAFKGLSIFDPQNRGLDISFVLLGLMLVLMIASVVGKRRWTVKTLPKGRSRRAAAQHIRFLFAFILLLLFSHFVAATDGGGDTKKIGLILAFTVIPIIYISLVFSKLEDYVVFFICLPWVFIVFTGLVLVSGTGDTSIGQGAFSGYQWRSRIAAMALGLAVSLIIANKMRPAAGGFLSISLLICFGVLMLLGGGRQGLLGSAAVITVMTFVSISRKRKRKARKLVLMRVLATLLFFALFYSFYLNSIDLSFTRLDRLFNIIEVFGAGGVSSVLESTSRIDFYKDAFVLFSENSIFGVGFGNYAKAIGDYRFSHPHNLFLETGAELGMFGLILLFAILLSSIRMILIVNRMAKQGGHSYPLLASVFLMVCLFAMSMVSGDLGTNYLFFISGFLTAKIMNMESELRLKATRMNLNN